MSSIYRQSARSILTHRSFGPLGRSDEPTGTTWADGFPHTAWLDMSAVRRYLTSSLNLFLKPIYHYALQYYISAFKTGSYPSITVSLDPLFLRAVHRSENSEDRRMLSTTGLVLTLRVLHAQMMLSVQSVADLGRRCVDSRYSPSTP